MSEASILLVITMGIGACLAICILGMRYAEREHIRRLQAKGGLAESQGLRSDFDALTARVEVLERLITDEDRKLAGEIDRLRTTNGASAQT
jgi:hypothetical protein